MQFTSDFSCHNLHIKLRELFSLFCAFHLRMSSRHCLLWERLIPNDANKWQAHCKRESIEVKAIWHKKPTANTCMWTVQISFTIQVLSNNEQIAKLNGKLNQSPTLHYLVRLTYWMSIGLSLSHSCCWIKVCHFTGAIHLKLAIVWQWSEKWHIDVWRQT